MEINDRNVLLQQFFGGQKASLFSASMNEGFADMIRADRMEAENAEVIKDFTSAKKLVSSTVEDKKVVFKKGDDVNDKQIKTAEEKGGSFKSKDKIDNKKADDIADDDAVSYVEKGGDAISDKKELKSEDMVVDYEQDVNASQTGEIRTDLAKEVGDIVYSNIDIPMLKTEDGAGDVMPIVNNVEVPVVVDSVLFEGNSEILPKDVVEAMKTEAEYIEAPVFTKEEALLMEQASYLDEKVISDVKLKIDVDVAEEKIAAPITKDVLQNRFEVDAVFQNAEDGSLVEFDVENDDFVGTKVIPESAKSTTILNKVVDAQQVFANVMGNAQETAMNTASETINLSVSGKEVVFETSNTVRQDAFAKINESSSRDTFKGIARDVVEQIKINITKSAVKGVDTIDIQLKPEDLGKIQIKMYIGKDGKLQADIISSRPETLDILQKDVSGLAKAFNDAGYETDSRSFNFSFQEENQAREQQKDDSGLLKFIGDTLEQEAESLAGNDNLTYDPILGLNIRV